ncbi:MAG: transcription elongation factor GreA [Erysipelotrichales bacterium]|nr:transcription elongation factor GreA [Erysipelotrichales bacterium]
MAQNDNNKVFVTQEGYNELKNEHYNLIHVVRQEVREELAAARSQGDLSENADYDAARDHQANVEARIRELEVMLENIVIIEESTGHKGNKIVRLGSTVTLYDLTEKEEATYTIVGSVEADPFNGRISNVCKLAQAILEHKEGDVVHVECDEPYDVEIRNVK